MRAILAACLATAAIACGGNNGNNNGDGDGGGGKMDACVGTECQVVDCAAMGMPPTKLTGKVFAPNGTLPLYGANVYIARDDPGAFPEGAQCTRCTSDLPGGPIVQTETNEAGEFTLENVPAGDDVRLVIALGKWRRIVTLSGVNQCADNPLPATQTSLPKNKSQGDIPKIAITTGDADALECLLPKLGIDTAEMTNANGDGRIHLYHGDGANSSNGQNLTEASTLWSDLDKLKQYDISIFSCEGSQLQNNNGGTNKTQQMIDNVKAYADLGGRVFLSHWHNIWISGKYQGGAGAPTPAVWNEIAEWSNDGNPNPDTTTATIDEVNNGKGDSFATWMLNVMGSTTRGIIPVTQYRKQAVSVDPAKAERWVYLTQQQGGPGVQNFQFTTPNEVSTDQRCGKVVFSDMHVSADSVNGNPFPAKCSTGPLTPQEKALAFMFFDIATCVGGIL